MSVPGGDDEREDRQGPGPRERPDSAPITLADVGKVLADWRQGDVLLDVGVPFFSWAHPGLPISAAARAAEPGGDVLLDALSDEIGYVVLSQTCDVVRSAERRPFIEVCPLVELSAETMVEAERGRTPRFAIIPALVQRRLVADLDRVMVVEKPVAAALPASARLAGCPTDADLRRFAQSLSRKHARFAFPDDFNAGMRRVAATITQRHGRKSEIGGFLAAVDDIRAHCPNWNAARPDVVLLFVFRTVAHIPADAEKHMADLISRFTATGAFVTPRAQATSYDTMTAARYRESDQLDFEHLSAADND